MINKLIAVDKNDQFLKLVDKNIAHQGKGILHRAFSVFIFNQKGEILIQQRSQYKKLWPLYWSNACCSHPNAENAKKTLLKQAEKRLKEEMGFAVKLKFIGKFYYQASYKPGWSEHEISYLLIGKYNGKIKLNKKEAADFKWLNLTKLQKQIKKTPAMFTPWFKKMIKSYQGIVMEPS